MNEESKGNGHGHGHGHCHNGDGHGRSHKHGHDGHCHTDAPAVLDEQAKLKIRVKHWIDHNLEHLATLEEWRDKAKEMGLEDVSSELGASAAGMKQSIESLKNALKNL